MNVRFYTLGCKVNQYESEQMRCLLNHSAFADTDLDIYVVNSCTVTAESSRKTRQAVNRIRKDNPDSFFHLYLLCRISRTRHIIFRNQRRKTISAATFPGYRHVVPVVENKILSDSIPQFRFNFNCFISKSNTFHYFSVVSSLSDPRNSAGMAIITRKPRINSLCTSSLACSP